MRAFRSMAPLAARAIRSAPVATLRTAVRRTTGPQAAVAAPRVLSTSVRAMSTGPTGDNKSVVLLYRCVAHVGMRALKQSGTTASRRQPRVALPASALPLDPYAAPVLPVSTRAYHGGYGLCNACEHSCVVLVA